MTEIVTLVGQKLPVRGFSHIEKNGKGIKCSQAAVANVVQYWNFRAPNAFANTTAVAISRSAGVTDAQLLDSNFKGLGFTAIKEFFQKEGFHVHSVDYRGKDQVQIEEEDPSVTIYGFLESGFPVIAVVRTRRSQEKTPADTATPQETKLNGKPEHLFKEELHALTIVGHTFDKNLWSVLARPLYYSKPLTGKGAYHSNSAWIKYFIVQDDNLGPYFFVPREDLAPVIEGLLVPMPFERIVVEPKEAESSAFNGLSDWVRTKHFEKDVRLAGANRTWFKLFRQHYDPLDQEGWVLRPFLRSINELIRLYEKHEFGSIIREKSGSEDPGAVFWVVELSWPNLYCYDELKIGEVVLNAETGTVWMVHLPGVVAFPATKEEPVFSQREDVPSRCFAGSAAY